MGVTAALPKFGAPLTERELRVLKHMRYGKTNGQIGKAMYLSEDTVKTHSRRLFRKLGVVDRVSAVMVGMETGLLSCACGRRVAHASKRMAVITHE